MKNNLINKSVIKAMSIGLSAVMTMGSVNLTAFAAEEESDENLIPVEEASTVEEANVKDNAEVTEEILNSEDVVEEVIEKAGDLKDKMSGNTVADLLGNQAGSLENIGNIEIAVDTLDGLNGDAKAAKEEYEAAVEKNLFEDNQDSELKNDVVAKDVEIAQEAVEETEKAIEILETAVTTVVDIADTNAQIAAEEYTSEAEAEEAKQVAQENLSNAEIIEQTAEEAVSTAEDKVNLAEDAVEQALSELTDATDAYDKAVDAVNAAQAELSSIISANGIDESILEVDEDGQFVVDETGCFVIKEGVVISGDAKEAIDKAKLALDIAIASQNAANDKFESAKTKLETAQTVYSESLSTLQDAKDYQQEAATKLSDAEKIQRELYAQKAAIDARKFKADIAITEATAKKAIADVQLVDARIKYEMAVLEYDAALVNKGLSEAELFAAKAELDGAKFQLRIAKLNASSADTAVGIAKYQLGLKERAYKSAEEKLTDAEQKFNDADYETDEYLEELVRQIKVQQKAVQTCSNGDYWDVADELEKLMIKYELYKRGITEVEFDKSKRYTEAEGGSENSYLTVKYTDNGKEIVEYYDYINVKADGSAVKDTRTNQIAIVKKIEVLSGEGANTLTKEIVYNSETKTYEEVFKLNGESLAEGQEVTKDTQGNYVVSTPGTETVFKNGDEEKSAEEVLALAGSRVVVTELEAGAGYKVDTLATRDVYSKDGEKISAEEYLAATSGVTPNANGSITVVTYTDANGVVVDKSSLEGYTEDRNGNLVIYDNQKVTKNGKEYTIETSRHNSNVRIINGHLAFDDGEEVKILYVWIESSLDITGNDVKVNTIAGKLQFAQLSNLKIDKTDSGIYVYDRFNTPHLVTSTDSYSKVVSATYTKNTATYTTSTEDYVAQTVEYIATEKSITNTETFTAGEVPAFNKNKGTVVLSEKTMNEEIEASQEELKRKEEAKTNAEKEYNKALVNKNNAEKAMNDAEETLGKAETAQSIAQELLEQAETRKSNAETRKSNAEEAVKKADERLKTAKQNKNTAKDKLDELTEAAKTAKDNFNAAKKEYDEATKAWYAALAERESANKAVAEAVVEKQKANISLNKARGEAAAALIARNRAYLNKVKLSAALTDVNEKKDAVQDAYNAVLLAANALGELKAQTGVSKDALDAMQVAYDQAVADLNQAKQNLVTAQELLIQVRVAVAEAEEAATKEFTVNIPVVDNEGNEIVTPSIVEITGAEENEADDENSDDVAVVVTPVVAGPIAPVNTSVAATPAAVIEETPAALAETPVDTTVAEATQGEAVADGNGAEEIVVDTETPVVIDEEESALAEGLVADKHKMNWWWLLIVAIMGASRYAMYKKHEEKVAAKEAQTEE